MTMTPKMCRLLVVVVVCIFALLPHWYFAHTIHILAVLYIEYVIMWEHMCAYIVWCVQDCAALPLKIAVSTAAAACWKYYELHMQLEPLRHGSTPSPPPPKNIPTTIRPPFGLDSSVITQFASSSSVAAARQSHNHKPPSYMHVCLCVCMPP